MHVEVWRFVDRQVPEHADRFVAERFARRRERSEVSPREPREQPTDGFVTANQERRIRAPISSRVHRIHR